MLSAPLVARTLYEVAVRSRAMPFRKIKIPASISLQVDNAGRQETVIDAFSFVMFIECVFKNPLWNESWKHGLAQRSIHQAAIKAEQDNAEEMTIAEDDWTHLEKACKFPQTAMPSGGVIPGFGFIPSIARQILPHQLAVIEAERIDVLP